MIGQQFGRLLVIERKGADKSGNVLWICQCSCGNTTQTRATRLRSGYTKSCGCLPREKIKERVAKMQISDTTPLSKTIVYQKWARMKNRCDNKNSIAYQDYGGRGISYDPKWTTFEGFWGDMSGTYVVGLSLDRIDVNGNYCKENCRWADAKVQSFNQRLAKNNTSGKSGVYYHNKKQRWVAVINIDGKAKELGRFLEFEDAVACRNKAELEVYGELKNDVRI